MKVFLKRQETRGERVVVITEELDSGTEDQHAGTPVQ